MASLVAKRNRQERLGAAIDALENKELSLREAAERYDIPKSTLHDHVSGGHTRCGAGRPPVLNALEEKSIVRSCQELAQLGFGVDRSLVGSYS